MQVAGWVSQGVLAKQALGFAIPTGETAYAMLVFLFNTSLVICMMKKFPPSFLACFAKSYSEIVEAAGTLFLQVVVGKHF